MTKASTLTLTSQLALSQVTEDQLAPFYDEAIFALGTLPWLLEATLLSVTSDQASFTLPATTLTMLQCWYDNRTLDRMTHAQLLALTPRWQEERGFPIAYTEEHLNLRTFRLYPLPAQPSESMTSILGGPFGEAFPGSNVAVLGVIQQQDLPSWLELPLALTLLAREYMRESPHRDPDFAHGCQQVASILMDMLTLPDVG